MTALVENWANGRHAIESRHRIVDNMVHWVIHWNSGTTSDAWLLDVATSTVLGKRIGGIVTIGLKLDAEVVL